MLTDSQPRIEKRFTIFIVHGSQSMITCPSKFVISIALNRTNETENKPTDSHRPQSEKLFDPPLGRGQWERQEDQAIIDYVRDNGSHSWVACAQYVPGRTSKQCRERWCNFLDPDMSLAPWTTEEDLALTNLHKNYGNQWARISEVMRNRSANAVKNRWNSAHFKRFADGVTAEQKLPSIWSLPIPHRSEFIGNPWEAPAAPVAVDSDVLAEVP
jgi:hypothetical protein